ncbi:MAG: PspA/IM30 family protein [Armatimonadetes bacterium]|nr:PspA/IM30 family protein [Armatimonadota bacterium]
MFRRLMVALRSFFGLFVRGMENPELMLQQYMDDMKSQIPRLNDTVAEVMKQEIMLRGQVERLQKQVTQLDQDVINAIKLGPQYENEAKLLISKMEQAKADLIRTESMLQTASSASEKAKIARDDYMRQMQLKIQEAQSALSRVKQAKMQEQLSGMMMSFQVGDQSDTLERMTEKIDERAAKAQARMELATDNVDTRLREIQRNSAEVAVDAKLEEYKRQLGMIPAEEEAPRTMSPVTEPPQTS